MTQSTTQTLTPQQIVNAILNGAQINGQYVSPAVVIRSPIGSSKVLNGPSSNVANTIQITPNGVGLVRKFYCLVNVTFTVATGTTLTRAPFGPANIMSQITFTDLNNLQRHNTSGKHLCMLNSVKQRSAMGAAFSNDSPLGFGSNFGGGANICPASITGANQAVTIGVMYEIPVMYQERDFRGAIYLGTTQASAQIGLTLNNNLFAPYGTDASDSVFSLNSGGVAPVINNVTVTPYQEYYDQLPTGSDGLPLLPVSYMQQIYQLINATQNGLVAGSGNSVPLANLRNYMSAIVEFDNGGTLNPGSDVNFWALQAANMYNFSQLDPITMDYITRREIMDSMPNGVYYFNWRNAPINTTQFGNINLVLNPKTVNTNAILKMGFEFFSSGTTLAGGGSIQSS